MKLLILPLLIFSVSSFASPVKDDNCKSPISGISSSLMNDMYNTMRINTDSIDKEKTTTELLFNEPVDENLAFQYANEDYRASPERWTTAKDFHDIYSTYNPRNLIIKFTFFNEGKKDIFLVSAFVNDYECSVRYNGYIIVKREF
ncbi:hypothetical protein ACQK5W_03765 [Pantoea sp. FN060301]|uniref:hypothetical protein n=1 Tax=Pantoea sp. FN060301 TaxID=3420380 RepID=UPI003D166F66